MINEYYYDRQLKKYFSEITNLKIFKQFDLKKYAFKVFIGGKGKGKSHFAFEEMINQLLKGNKVGYIRNTTDEIKQIKNDIAQYIIAKTPYKNLSVSAENITDRDSKKVLVVFISTKNYNKISGNEVPFGMVFYDEFNQDLGKRTNKLLYDFFSILQTCFRGNKWNVWACGNTKTRNNVIYNLFRLDLLDINHKLEIIDIDKSLLIIRYRDDFFKELNMEKEDLNLIKKYNKPMYDSMIKGVSYDKEDELVINNLEKERDKLIKLNEVIIYENRVYEYFSTHDKKYYFFIRNDELKGSIDLINELTKNNINVYELELDYGNICGNIARFQNSFISLDIIKKLKNQQLFFNDFQLYLAFKDDNMLTFLKDFKELTK